MCTFHGIRWKRKLSDPRALIPFFFDHTCSNRQCMGLQWEGNNGEDGVATRIQEPYLNAGEEGLQSNRIGGKIK